MSPTSVTDHRLYGWEPDWAFAQSPVKALLFGHMVRLATPVMHQYQSDLYHDATWLEHKLRPTHTFEWLVRPSGTNLSDDTDVARNSARIGVRIGAGDTAKFYRVELTASETGEYAVRFTDVPLAEVADLPPLTA